MMRYRYLRFPGALSKAVTFSYDDGCVHDKRFSDVITKYGLKATFNVCSGFMGKDDWHLTAEALKECMLDRGHEIAVHGKFHRANGAVSSIDGIRDVLECRTELEHTFGRIIRGMAYPDSGIRVFLNGSSYENVKQYLTELGIVYARTLQGDNDSFALPTDWHRWMPTAHHDNPQIMDYISKFVSYDDKELYGCSRTPKLFYIWGHSYEFDRNNNWEHLDEICTALGGKQDTWYATNIEIYEYVKAYDSLIFSADGTVCHNPTLITIFFNVDGTLYCVEPGKTVCIKE